MNFKFNILVYCCFIVISCKKDVKKDIYTEESWNNINSKLIGEKQIDTLRNGNLIVYNKFGFEVYDNKTLNLLQNQSLKFSYSIDDNLFNFKTTVIDNYLITFRKLNNVESVFMVYNFNNNYVSEAILNIDTISKISKNNFNCNLSKIPNKNGTFDLLVEYYINDKFILYTMNFEQLFNRFNNNNSSCIKFVSDFSNVADQFPKFMKIRNIYTDINDYIIATSDLEFANDFGGLVIDRKGNLIADLPIKGNYFYLKNKLYGIKYHVLDEYTSNYLSFNRLQIPDNLIPELEDIKPLNNKTLYYLNNDKLVTLNENGLFFDVKTYRLLSGFNLKLQTTDYTFVSNNVNDIFYIKNPSLK